MQNETWDYEVTGRPYGIAPLLLTAVPALLLTVVAVDQLQPGEGKLFALGIGLVVPAAMLLVTAVRQAIRLCCFRVAVGKRGFYFRTGLKKGRYCLYGDVVGCSLEKRSPRGKSNTLTAHMFTYVLTSGEQGEIPYDPTTQEAVFRALSKRIRRAQDA